MISYLEILRCWNYFCARKYTILMIKNFFVSDLNPYRWVCFSCDFVLHVVYVTYVLIIKYTQIPELLHHVRSTTILTRFLWKQYTYYTYIYNKQIALILHGWVNIHQFKHFLFWKGKRKSSCYKTYTGVENHSKYKCMLWKYSVI